MHIDKNEIFNLAISLELHHAIFYKIFNMGVPETTESISTAAVAFDSTGDFCTFLLNVNFWNTLSFEQKKFIICHESLHILFEHGKRYISNEHSTIANYAMDVVINHTLTKKFNFDRSVIDPENKYCWIDTVFLNRDDVKEDMNWEYYFSLLIDDEKNNTGMFAENGQKPTTVDNHDDMFNNGDMSSFFDKLKDELTNGELNSFINSLPSMTDANNGTSQLAGIESSTSWLSVDGVAIVKKRKWESVIKDWMTKHLIFSETNSEQWARTNRRFTFLPDNMFLPSSMEVEEKNDAPHKIDIWFFQDTSGSCVHLAKRFFSAAKSLPTNRFNVKLFCFDTRVYETNLTDAKIKGGGGTSFSCIESYIQKKIKHENIKYPKAIFAISDGQGNNFTPEKPKHWHWFLTSNYKRHIPTESQVYLLSEFE